MSNEEWGMSNKEYKIFIVDDDEAIRRSLSLLIRSAGYSASGFSGAEEFLESEDYDGKGCILLDIFLDGESGLELQEKISKKFHNLPIIYITGLGDVPMSVQALKKGAINFLQKPVDDVQLLEAVEEALRKSAALVTEKNQILHIKALIDKLTPREYEIFQYILTGMLNKQIASELNIAEHTVKLHRGKITEKLGVKSVAEMVRIAEKLNLL
jgi:FixJ family two-component response regulator